MAKEGTLTSWLKENCEKVRDKEALVQGACKVYPGSTRKTVLNRIADLVHRGDMPQSFLGTKGGSQKGAGSFAKPMPASRPAKQKKEGIKVPKKFRMAVDASLVKDEWDDEGKIDEGLANLGGQVIKDNDFRTELGIAQDRWKLVSNSERYTDNKIELKGKTYRGVYWGQKEVIKSLQKKVDMV
jgi:hypothetical protein